MSTKEQHIKVSSINRYDPTMIETLTPVIYLYDLQEPRANPGPGDYRDVYVYLPDGSEIGQQVILRAQAISDSYTIIKVRVSMAHNSDVGQGQFIWFYQYNDRPVRLVWNGGSWEVLMDTSHNAGIVNINTY